MNADDLEALIPELERFHERFSRFFWLSRHKCVKGPRLSVKVIEGDAPVRAVLLGPWPSVFLGGVYRMA
jgi:hypothetical protein